MREIRMGGASATFGLASALQQTNIIVLDVETKKTETWTGKDLLGVAIGVPRGLDVTPYYILPADLHRYKSRLAELDIVAHNVLFDAEIMRQNGCPLEGKWWD